MAVPEALDEARFEGDLAAVALTHAFVRLASFDKVDARPAGDLSRLERMITIEAAALMAEAYRAFPALTDWCRQLGRALRHRWPDTDVDTQQLEPFVARR